MVAVILSIMTLTIEAPAKINLHLQVGKLRSDGYHDLLSLMHLVDLSDRVSLRTEGKRGTVELEGDFDCLKEDNLLYKAASAYLRERQKRIPNAHPAPGLTISCLKRIPAGGGLGGGSSDAAALLKLLERFFGAFPERGGLDEIALSLGSDVPFFLHTGAEIAQGRGEVLEPVEPLPAYPLVLVFPSWRISTPDAYAAIDRFRLEKADHPRFLSPGQLRESYRRPVAQWPFFNDFTSPVLLQFPESRDLLLRLQDQEALFSQMSGSGSTFFGLFDEEKTALRAFERLKSMGYRCHLGKMLARPYDPVYNGR